MTNSTPLRAVRKQRGLSQEKLAERAGLHRLTVTRIEAGGAHCVKLNDLRAIAEVLECDWRQIHGSGVPLLAETNEDLAEIVGARPVQCAGASGDPIEALAKQLGRDASDPEFRQYVVDVTKSFLDQAEVA